MNSKIIEFKTKLVLQFILIRPSGPDPDVMGRVLRFKKLKKLRRELHRDELKAQLVAGHQQSS